MTWLWFICALLAAVGAGFSVETGSYGFAVGLGISSVLCGFAFLAWAIHDTVQKVRP